MRAFLLILSLSFLLGCASAPGSASKPGRAGRPTEGTRALLDPLRLTLDVRYYAGETLSLETRVIVISGKNPVTARLKDCGTIAGKDFQRFTTGGHVLPGEPCHVLIEQPGEPAQVFTLETPGKSSRLATWTEWRKPECQIVHPMPAQTLIHKPDLKQPLTVPPARQFEIRYQLTALNAADPAGR